MQTKNNYRIRGWSKRSHPENSNTTRPGTKTQENKAQNCRYTYIARSASENQAFIGGANHTNETQV